MRYNCFVATADIPEKNNVHVPICPRCGNKLLRQNENERFSCPNCNFGKRPVIIPGLPDSSQKKKDK